MDTRVLRNTFILSLFQLAMACCVAIVQRWMLGISTPEKDIHWLKNQAIWRYLLVSWKIGKWYRGIELFHQLRGWKLVKDAL